MATDMAPKDDEDTASKDGKQLETQSITKSNHEAWNSGAKILVVFLLMVCGAVVVLQAISSVTDRRSVSHGTIDTIGTILLCVHGKRSIYQLKVAPEDGVCDYRFIDEIGFDGQNITTGDYIDGPTLLATFQKQAMNSTKTQFGLSFSPETFLGGKKEFFKELRHFYKNNVIHHGLLQVVGDSSYIVDTAMFTSKLKLLREFQKKEQQSPVVHVPSLLGIGLQLSNYLDVKEQMEFSHFIGNIASLDIDIVVFRTHNDQLDNAVVTYPPTAWKTAYRAPQGTFICYEFLNSLGNHEVMEDVYTLKTGLSKLYILDHKESIIRKINWTYSTYKRPKLGWAVYSLEFEDVNGDCAILKLEAYHRLNAIRAYLNK